MKGVVGSAALTGVGTATAPSVNSATAPNGEGGGIIQYYGVENTVGPAPRAMPQIPIGIDDGYVKGRWPEPETVAVPVATRGGRGHRSAGSEDTNLRRSG